MSYLCCGLSPTPGPEPVLCAHLGNHFQDAASNQEGPLAPLARGTTSKSHAESEIQHHVKIQYCFNNLVESTCSHIKAKFGNRNLGYLENASVTGSCFFTEILKNVYLSPLKRELRT